jgi:hypothetical protein
MDACLLCGSDEHHHVDFEIYDEREIEIEYQQCTSCGLVFQKDPLSPDKLESYYRGTYRMTIQGQEGPSTKDRWVQQIRANSIVTFLDTHLHHIDRHLDIGSSSGDLLLAVSDKYGCAGWGVEPGDEYREYSITQGARVCASLSDLRSSTDERFDLITMSHVLEHLLSPKEYLKDLRSQWLSEEGMLFIEVPNLYGHPSLELSHITVYSLQTLERLLYESGFTLIDHRLHGQPYSRLLRLFISVLAIPTTNGKVRRFGKPHLAFMRLRRKVGLSVLYGARAISSRLLRKGQLEPWRIEE